MLNCRIKLIGPVRRVAAPCVLLGALVAAGCATGSASGGKSGRTQSDVLRHHYADLATGRFAVIADFEDPGHMQLFHVRANRADGAVGAAAFERTTGVSATGGRCLKVDLRGPGSSLVADNSAARAWLLKRDWRPYNLLVMNVHSPASGLQLDLSVVAGAGQLASEAHSLVALHAGWNLLRLDLGEAADFAALDDVRQLCWSLPGIDHPVTLRIDDILLANNREELFGATDAGLGHLYVVREGRRINVGAAGRFELGFANGQIVCWYGLEDDPLRINNLVGAGNALGPTPVVLPDEAAAGFASASRVPLGFPSLGEMVAARQRVVEANDVRVVVLCEWTFGEVGRTTPDDPPHGRWTYTIYPSGHVYVSYLCITEQETFKPANLGLVVGRLPTAGMAAEAHQPTVLRDRPIHREVCYGWMTASAADAGLLYVAYDSRAFPQMKPIWDAQSSRVSILAFGGEVDYPVQRGCCLLSVWPKGNCGAPLREETAISYCRKPQIEFLVGGLDRGTPGDEDNDGFNERCGTLMLAPHANRVQLRLDGRERKIVSPAFCVLGAAGREAWVYVDYIIHQPVAGDAEGNQIFQIPGTIDDEVIVEVYLRNPPASD